jgi:hypothetical protein
MRYGGGFRALAALLLLGFVGLVALGAYGAGFAAGNGSPAFTPANPPASPAGAWAYGGAFGVGHVIGFLVTILIFIIVIRLVLAVIFGGPRRRMWGHPGYWHGGDPAQFGPAGSYGGWHRGPWHEVGQSYFDEFHNKAHGNQPPAAGGSATGDPNAGGPTADQPR